MKTTKTLREIKEDLLVGMLDDYVGLWEFLHDLREFAGVHDVGRRRQHTMDLLAAMLSEGLIVVGDLEWDGQYWRLKPWRLNRMETLREIRRRWDELETPEPVVADDVCWVNCTEKGERLALQLWKADSAEKSGEESIE